MEIRWIFFTIIVLIKWRLSQLHRSVETFTLCIAWSFICLHEAAAIKYCVLETFHCFCVDEMYFFKANLAFFFKLLPVISCVKAKTQFIKFSITVYLTRLFFHLCQDLPELEEVEIVPVTPAGVSSLCLSLSLSLCLSSLSLPLSMCVCLCLPVCLGVTIKS